MKTAGIYKSVLLAACLLAVGLMAGCDQAEKALNKSDVGVSAEATKLVSSAVKALSGIKDVESAKAALPVLKDLDVDFGSLAEKGKEMSPEQKSKLTGAVAQALPGLEGAISKVTALPGVGNLVGPTLGSIQAKLKSLS